MLAALALSAGTSFAQHVLQAVAGAVRKVAAETIAVRIARGSEEIFKYTEKSGVREATAGKDATKIAPLGTWQARRRGH